MAGALDLEAHGLGELVTARDQKGSHHKPIVKCNRLLRFQGLKLDIAERHQLIPRALGAKKLGHPRHGKDRHVACPHYLAAQVYQAAVMPDMGVGQEDAIKAGATPGADSSRPSSLSWKRNSGVQSMIHCLTPPTMPLAGPSPTSIITTQYQTIQLPLRRGLGTWFRPVRHVSPELMV